MEGFWELAKELEKEANDALKYTWLIRGITDGRGEEIRAETAEEAKRLFAEKYPERTRGGNPKMTSNPIKVR